METQKQEKKTFPLIDYSPYLQSEDSLYLCYLEELGIYTPKDDLICPSDLGALFPANSLALFLGSISVSPYEKSRITKIKGIASSLPQISISKTVKMGRSKVQLKKGDCLVTRQAIILDRADSSDPILHFLWKTTHLDMMRLLHKRRIMNS